MRDAPEIHSYLDKLAILRTPEVHFGTTYYSLVEFRADGRWEGYLTEARLLSFVAFPGALYSIGHVGRFPFGYDVLPDHV